MQTPIELPDHRGLICGFLLRPELPAQLLEWENLDRELAGDRGTVWLHFNLADVRARNWITNCHRIPEVARDMLLATAPHIQLEVIDNGFVCVLGDLHYEFDADPHSLGLLRIYVERQCIISVRGRPLKAIDQLRRDLIRGELIETSLDLMVHFLQHANEIFERVIIDLREVVDEMEDKILKGNVREQRGELGTVRRMLARLRRHLNGNRHALSQQLMPHLPNWCRETDISELRRGIERLNALIQDLELVEERSRLLQEEMAGQLQEMVNRNLYILSIVTTIFLPATLITGIFGMNVGGLPWNQEPIGFWLVNFVIVSTLAVTFMVLQRQQFL